MSNFKKFNKFINNKHYKLESINNAINFTTPNVYMTSANLKDTFFSVTIQMDHQKYLKFLFKNLFKFKCVPKGYGPTMRVFTKISKDLFSHMRRLGHESAVYVDDSWMQRRHYQTFSRMFLIPLIL